jgi:galactoside O-acetyltransferase
MLKMNMSMTEKIKAGKLFTDMCEGLPEKRLRGKTLMYEFNHSHPSEGKKGNDSNLLIVFYVQIMPNDFVMQLHRF